MERNHTREKFKFNFPQSQREFGLPFFGRFHRQGVPVNRPGIEELSTQGIEVIRRERYLRTFGLPREVNAGLSDQERRVLKALEGLEKPLEELFRRQEARPTWPEGTTKTEIDNAPENVRNPYTSVQRNENGELEAIPYTDIPGYDDLFKQIASSLRNVKDLYRWKNADAERVYYSLQKAFETGKPEYFLEAEVVRLTCNASRIVAIIGLYDENSDPHAIKYSAQGWWGVLDEQTSAYCQTWGEKVLKWRSQEVGRETFENRVLAIDTVAIVGQAAKFEWSGNSLPCQRDLRRRLRSDIHLFKSVISDNFHQRVGAINSVIETNEKTFNGVDDKTLSEVCLKTLTAHEFGHSEVAQDLELRLNDYETAAKELFCELFSLWGYYNVLQQQPDSEQRRLEQETVLAAYLSKGKLEYENFTNKQIRPEYHAANTIILNYCLKNGSLKIKDNQISWDDSDEVFTDIGELFEKVDYIQLSGIRDDAIHLYDEYFHVNDSIYKDLHQDQKRPAFLSKEKPKKPITNKSNKRTPRKSSSTVNGSIASSA